MDVQFSNILDLNNFLKVLSGSAWGASASTETIDNLFQCALHLRENTFPELEKNYPGINFNNSVDLLLKNIIENPHLNEHITLHAISKYINLFSSEKLSMLLESVMCEFELREQLFDLIKEMPNVELDFCKVNRLLQDLDGPNCDNKILNAVKFETQVLLDALLHCSDLSGPVLVNKLVNCLECQADLRLWFILFKKEHVESVIELCSKYGSFLDAVFVFFDKFAEEVESTYDEDLNVRYSHVNLDFEDFIKIFQLFLEKKPIVKRTEEFLKGKTLLDKNYCFWIDLKSCVES